MRRLAAADRDHRGSQDHPRHTALAGLARGGGRSRWPIYDEGAGQMGLTLIAYDGGNSDTLVLATVDQAGKLSTIMSASWAQGSP